MNDELLSTLIICDFLGKQAIRPKFPLFSPLTGHFWAMKGIFRIIVYEDRGVSLVGWFVQEDYPPLVVSLFWGASLSLPDFMG
jgi:hypothetical protein